MEDDGERKLKLEEVVIKAIVVLHLMVLIAMGNVPRLSID
jgi:hypothetical protein